MTLSHDSILSIVELVLYAPLLPLTAYLLFRHGRHGILGYLYLNAACTVRAVSDIVQLATSAADSKPSLGATILSSVGLSPLMLALAGMLHENHHYRLETSDRSPAMKSKITKLLWFVQLHIHTVCVVGMVLLIIGGVHIQEATTSEKANSAIKLREAGSIILLLLWLGLGQYAVYLTWKSRNLPNRGGLVSLAFWCLLASPFLGIKVVYNVVYYFDHDDSNLNPNTGSLAIKAQGNATWV
ncbi:hypothetical protein PRZ48_009125 [Zasmidium cellare]|uniref:DUF7702 domain-containing protein n=1 Tax=Zasmidium cellare TaxID=395010 RepID=A0ABR0EIP9_ZASCE|nr:hypothetical protein PRZ48_009125 [Zasmidium cellare]